jgi:hypothetical protein
MLNVVSFATPLTFFSFSDKFFLFFLNPSKQMRWLRNSIILTYDQKCVRICAQIPVFRGAAESVVETSLRAEHVHGNDGFGDVSHPDSPDTETLLQKEHAVNFLTRITSQNPGTITRPG